LGVSETATEEEVKSAWRRLCKEWHPATFAENGEEVKKVTSEKFDKIQKAYECIKQRGLEIINGEITNIVLNFKIVTLKGLHKRQLITKDELEQAIKTLKSSVVVSKN